MNQFKIFYVKSIHITGHFLACLGILTLCEKTNIRLIRWFRSLFSIYDLSDLVYLDLPWWTFDSIDFVESFLSSRNQARVFEWGSGASTIWLSKRCSEVISIEHDMQWGEKVRSLASQNYPGTLLNIILPNYSGCIKSKKTGFEGQFFDDYVKSIREFDGKFDLIVIDGRAREACLAEAIKKLSKDGYILFDDTKRKRYQTAIKKTDLNQRHLSGLAVSLPFFNATDILSHPKL
ncbi:class I SAM-dependent methyltransferase [Kiloniella majae]|uniref:class I SAM-dependent methyltransferase n=1 Tax=Kiloniella majae TaxID=1938558 RepID=UPI000A2791BD|nr:class I SAM-dependent methyltransferase [Kiloniella majae]